MIITCSEKDCDSTEVSFGKPQESSSDHLFNGEEIHTQRIGIGTYCLKCGHRDELVLTQCTGEPSAIKWRFNNLTAVGVAA